MHIFKKRCREEKIKWNNNGKWLKWRIEWDKMIIIGNYNLWNKIMQRNKNNWNKRIWDKNKELNRNIYLLL